MVKPCRKNHLSTMKRSQPLGTGKSPPSRPRHFRGKVENMEVLRPGDPESIGPYSLKGRLGSGGMGVVFLAEGPAGNVALKVVRQSFLDDSSLVERFSREIDTLKTLDHPHIAAILDSGATDDFAWMAVEFANGKTLKAHIDLEGPLGEAEWFALASGLCRALRYAHSLDIVHRDITPQNIILEEAGPKLIDFGIAQGGDATSLTLTGAIVGSPAWSSPEQLDGELLTPAADMFSLGSVLYFAATGSNPWALAEHANSRAYFNKILSHKPDLSGLTRDQQTLVAGLLAKEPQKRTTAEELLLMLEPASVGASAPAPSLGRFGGNIKNPLLLVSVALTGALIGGTAVGLGSFGVDAPPASEAVLVELEPQTSGDFVASSEENLENCMSVEQQRMWRTVGQFIGGKPGTPAIDADPVRDFRSNGAYTSILRQAAVDPLWTVSYWWFTAGASPAEPTRSQSGAVFLAMSEQAQKFENAVPRDDLLRNHHPEFMDSWRAVADQWRFLETRESSAVSSADQENLTKLEEKLEFDSRQWPIFVELEALFICGQETLREDYYLAVEERETAIAVEVEEVAQAPQVEREEPVVEDSPAPVARGDFMGLPLDCIYEYDPNVYQETPSYCWCDIQTWGSSASFSHKGPTGSGEECWNIYQAFKREYGYQ